MIEHEHGPRATFNIETKSVPAEVFETTKQLLLAARGIGHAALFGIPALLHDYAGYFKRDD